jgi:anti-anti-sigma factor
VASVEAVPLTAANPGQVQVIPDEQMTLVMLAGEIDLAVREDMNEARQEVLARGLPVQLDLYRVTFIDSIGIAFIAQLLMTERDRGRRVAVLGASKATRQTLLVHGVADLLDGLSRP